MNEMKCTIENLIEITKIEFNKETKEEQEEIEKMKKENDKFVNEFLQFKMNIIGKKCKLKKRTTI